MAKVMGGDTPKEIGSEKAKGMAKAMEKDDIQTLASDQIVD